ncbi:MAG: TlpA disulfide reductase family protein [Candidatus Zixiibacteriota bacterium]
MTQKTRILAFAILLAVIFVSAKSLKADNAIDSLSAIAAAVKDPAQLKNKVVYVDFWASWCGPCRRSFPWMKELETKYQERGLKFVTVNLDRDRAAAKKFLADLSVPFEVIYDSTGTLATIYGLEAMPTSFIYGRDGKLRKQHRGFNPKETPAVDSLIDKLLKEGSKK